MITINDTTDASKFSIALLGNEALDPIDQLVDKDSLRFGPEGEGTTIPSNDDEEHYVSSSGKISIKDVSRDGFNDVVSRYDVNKISFLDGSPKACLEGEIIIKNEEGGDDGTSLEVPFICSEIKIEK